MGLVFRYRLDDDAQSKLREIVEKRAEDKYRILESIKTLGGRLFEAMQAI